MAYIASLPAATRAQASIGAYVSLVAALAVTLRALVGA